MFTPTLEKLYIYNTYVYIELGFFLSLTKTSPYLFMAASGLSYGTWASLELCHAGLSCHMGLAAPRPVGS